MEKQHFILVIIIAAAVTFVLIILPSATKENQQNPHSVPVAESEPLE